MTTPAQAAAEAKKYVGYAEKGASKLSELSKAANELKDAGKTLSEVDDVLTKLAFMSKIAIGLQVVSVGLSVVQAFLPIKSKEDQILDAVQQVGRDVANLKGVVNQQFKAMGNKVLDANAKQTLQNQVAVIETAHSILSTMAFNRRNGKSTRLQEAALQKIDLLALRKAVGQIEDYCVGTLLAPNILQLAYNQNWGNVDEVLNLGTYLLQYAHMAAATHAAVQVIHDRAANPNFTDADAFATIAAVAGDVHDRGSYEAKLKNIAEQVHKWGQKCVDAKTRYSLIESYFGYYTVVNNKTLDVTDLSGTATRLHNAYKKTWPMLNFSVMAYKNLSGFSEHGMKYSGPKYRTKTFLHVTDKNGEKMNIVLYMVKRKTKTIPKPKGYLEGNNKSSQNRINGVNTLSSILNGHKRFGINYWHQTNVDNVLDYAGTYGAFVNPSHTTQWHGDFLWIGWNDNGWPVDSQNGKRLVGLSSDNPFALKIAKRQKTANNGPNNASTFYDAYEGYDVLVIHDGTH
ncbi:hypothetical protein [Fretibacter rubidus]|uniref:hypothetical protein n=1 Tax=Fretibacter rubidus TaxID=570162 RepID=UPI00352A2BBA